MFDFDSIFWQMVWANFVWALSTFVVISIPLSVFGYFKLKKAKARRIGPPAMSPKSGPRVLCFEPPKAEGGHCPLCGQGWPLAGPIIPTKGETDR